MELSYLNPEMQWWREIPIDQLPGANGAEREAFAREVDQFLALGEALELTNFVPGDGENFKARYRASLDKGVIKIDEEGAPLFSITGYTRQEFCANWACDRMIDKMMREAYKVFKRASSVRDAPFISGDRIQELRNRATIIQYGVDVVLCAEAGLAFYEEQLVSMSCLKKTLLFVPGLFIGLAYMFERCCCPNTCWRPSLRNIEEKKREEQQRSIRLPEMGKYKIGNLTYVFLASVLEEPKEEEFRGPIIKDAIAFHVAREGAHYASDSIGSFEMRQTGAGTFEIYHCKGKLQEHLLRFACELFSKDPFAAQLSINREKEGINWARIFSSQIKPPGSYPPENFNKIFKHEEKMYVHLSTRGLIEIKMNWENYIL